MALIGALVVVELAIVGVAARALSSGSSDPLTPFARGAAWASAPKAEPVLDRSFAAGDTPHVVVDVHDVDLVVQTGAAPTVHVVETRHSAGFVSGHFSAARAERTADGVRVATASDDGPHVVFGELDRAVRLIVPAGARIEVESAGSVATGGLRAKLIAHSENGAISVRDHRGDLELTTANGRIELHDVQGAAVSLTSHNGRLVLERVGADRLDASTGNGRVEAKSLRVIDGALSSGNGVVRLALAENSDATVTAHSENGRVRIQDPLAADSAGEHDERIVRLGSGRGRFDVSTGNGSITLSEGARV